MARVSSSITSSALTGLRQLRTERGLTLRQVADAASLDVATLSTPPDPLPVHDGHDWLYVLSGRMCLVLGDEDLTIEPGEAVEFSTPATARPGRARVVGHVRAGRPSRVGATN